MANFAWLLNAVAGAPSNTGRTVRQAMSVALGGATAARPLGAQSGVRPGTPASTVALPTATSWVIHPHAGVLDTQASAFAGPYWYAVGADETGTVNAAHATWPRKDILWVRIDDPGETDGSTVPAIVTGYTAGVAAATPAVPATPARAMRLATISVPLSGGGAPTIVFDAPSLTPPGAFDPAVVGQVTATSAEVYTSDVQLVAAPAITGDGVKRFKITAQALLLIGVAGEEYVFSLKDNGTVIRNARATVHVTTATDTIILATTHVPSAGSHVYTFTSVRLIGTGTGGHVQATVTDPIEITVEQIG